MQVEHGVDGVDRGDVALDAGTVRRFLARAEQVLDRHRAELDALNVFPVADADTGTNLCATVTAARAALHGGPDDGPDGGSGAGAALTLAAEGAVLGARGNSGVIVSQVFAGLAEAAAGADARYGATELARGLRAAARLARASVAEPAEGTVLTVLDAVAAAVPSDAVAVPSDAVADRSDAVAVPSGAANVVVLLADALRAGDAALLATPDSSAAQGRPAVVDAGGRGALLVLDALLHELDATTADRLELSVRVPAARPAAALLGERETGSDTYGYEVQYLLDSDAEHVARLRTRLTRLGDSVAVAAAPGGVWNVHVHVDDVGAALEAGVAAGRPHRITVVRFADQVQKGDVSTTRRTGGADAADTADRDVVESAVVAVAPGAGLAHLFEAEGVHVVDPSGDAATDTGRDAVRDAVLDAVRAAVRPASRGTTGAAAGGVVLLPNASRVTGVAEAAAVLARAEGLRVAVVPTRSPVQGLAAVAVHDPSRAFDDDVVAMAEAAAATRFAEIVVARRAALTSVGLCEPGDVLGLIDGEVVAVGRGVMAVSLGVLDRLLGVGAEVLTVLTGLDAPASLGDLLARHVAERAPLTEISVYAGGQPDVPLIIGAE